jgi:hypothetical protein
MRFFLVLFSALLLFPMTATCRDDTVTVNMKLSGTVTTIGGVQTYDVNLKGAPGKARAQGAGTGVEPATFDELPAGHVCADNPYEPETGTAGLLLTQATATVTFEDLSMLFLTVADDAYVCLFTPFVYGPYEIIGGTGRFEDATGYIVMEFDVYRGIFPDGSAIGAETGIAYGEIVVD